MTGGLAGKQNSRRWTHHWRQWRWSAVVILAGAAVLALWIARTISLETDHQIAQQQLIGARAAATLSMEINMLASAVNNIGATSEADATGTLTGAHGIVARVLAAGETWALLPPDARASAVANGAGPGLPALTLPYNVNGQWFVAALHAPREGGLAAAAMPLEPILSALEEAAASVPGVAVVSASTGRVWISAPFDPAAIGQPADAPFGDGDVPANALVAPIASPFGLELALHPTTPGLPAAWWTGVIPTIVISALLILGTAIAVRFAVASRPGPAPEATQPSLAGHGGAEMDMAETVAGAGAPVSDVSVSDVSVSGASVSEEPAGTADATAAPGHNAILRTGLSEILRPQPIVAYRARVDSNGDIDLHDVHVGDLPGCPHLESHTQNSSSAFLEALCRDDRFALERAIQLAAGLPGDAPQSANGGWLRLGTSDNHIWMRHWLRRIDAEDHVDVLGLLVESSAENAEYAALIEARNAAEAVSVRKSRFIASVSHELRTPLNAIIGFAELMEKETLGPIGTPRYKGYLADISTSGRHLRDLINDIIDISRVEAEELDLADIIFDVGDELASCARLVSEQIDKAGLEFVSDLPDALPKLRADVLRFRQIILNLLGNAIKFTPTGGEIGVSVRLTPEGTMRISVIDTGVGMDEAGIERALQPFGRIETPDRTGIEGTGLGLPIARALMEFHGGKLDIVSARDAGTTVNLTFPIDRVIDDTESERAVAAGA